MCSIMKPSGIEWIGDMPSDWNLIRVGDVAEVINGYSFESSKYVDDGMFVVRITNVDDGVMNGRDPKYYPMSYQNAVGQAMLKENDLLMTLTGYIGLVAFMDNTLLPAGLNQRVAALRLKNNICDRRMLFYSFMTDDFKRIAEADSQSTAQTNMSTEYLKKVKLPCPPQQEQQKIADYLDEFCSKIDDTIALKSDQLEQLAEYKKSLISECVCGRVPGETIPHLVSTNIEWASEIPDNWLCTRIKYFYDVTLGKMLQPQKKSNSDSLETYLCAANLKWRGIDTSVQKEMWFSSSDKAKTLLTIGDLLIMEGGSAGTACIYNGEFAPCYMQNSINRCRTKDNRKTSNKWLYYWLFHLYYQGYIDSLSDGPTFTHYTKEKVEATPLVIPPISEQNNIVHYLDKQCSIIDNMMDKIALEIETLEQYKKSTIWEYVTGKRRVPIS